MESIQKKQKTTFIIFSSRMKRSMTISTGKKNHNKFAVVNGEVTEGI